MSKDYLDISDTSSFKQKYAEESLLSIIQRTLRNKVKIVFSNIKGQKLANLIPFLSLLKGLDLSSNYIEDEGINSIEKLVNLEFLSLRANDLKGQTLNKLSSLKKLEILDLSANYLTDEFLSNLDLIKFPNLKALDLSCCPQITYKGFGELKPSPSIRILWLQENKIDQEWINHISLFCNLEFLNLSYSYVAPSWLEPLKSLKNIRKISLEEKILEEAGLIKFLDDTEMTELSILYYKPKIFK